MIMKIVLSFVTFAACLCAVEGVSVTTKRGESQGERQVLVVEVLNTSQKAIQGIVFKVPAPAGGGMSLTTTRILGLGGGAQEEKLLQPGDTREFRIRLQPGTAVRETSVSVECVYYADGTADGPGKDEHIAHIRGMIAGIKAEQTKSRKQ